MSLEGDGACHHLLRLLDPAVDWPPEATLLEAVSQDFLRGRHGQDHANQAG